MPNENGMEYENVRTRVKRMNRAAGKGKVKNHEAYNNLTKSLINQAERRERGSGKEIIRELNHKSKYI